ncbi:MAG: sirohydrochlorin cobaltochelatase [Clostridia bacterium]|nr:sirohydrochlorin cobaltochelatase [Clostridia bacterium]
MNKTLLVVSFGTSYADAESRGIRPIEDALKAAFPDRRFARAFTSRIIKRKLNRQGIDVMNEIEALEMLRNEGCDDILVVPTHVIPGFEYEKIRAAAEGCTVSEPLLCVDEDYTFMADLLNGIADKTGRKLLLMGHGTEHAANESYTRLNRMLADNAALACVEGETTLDTLIDTLSPCPVTLMAMMIVAGDHARNDMGGDEPDSWKSILTDRGFEVEVMTDALGAIPEIQNRFVTKAQKALEGRN